MPPRMVTRWFAPATAAVLAVVGLCGFVVTTASRDRAEAQRVASSSAWSRPTPGTSTASHAPTVAPPSSASVLIKAGCHTVHPRTAASDVDGLGSDCDWSPSVLLTADAYPSTAARDAGAAELLTLGVGGGQILVGPGWTVFASPWDLADVPGVLAAVARRIGGTIRR